LVIFKLNEQTGQLEEVHKAKKWFEIPFDLIGIGGAVMPKGEATLEFTEGTYVAMLQGKSAVGLVGGSTLSLTHDTIYDYNIPSKFMGEVIGEATEEADVVLLKVNDEPIEAGTATTVQGEYGVLTINSDGTYTYSVTKPNDMTGWEPPYGKVDSFRLVTEDANCKTTIETLNIKIGTHTAIDDFNDVSVAMENLVTTEKVIDGVSAATKELSKDFTVAENTLTSATLQVNTTTLATRLEYSIINKDTGVVVATNTGNATRAIDVNIANLEPGNYTLEINCNEVLGHLKINDSSFTSTSQHLNEYTPTAINPVTGVLLENDAGSHNVAELKIGNKIVFVSAPNKGADSIEIEG